MFRLLTLLFLALHCEAISNYSDECIAYITKPNDVYQTTLQHFEIDCNKDFYFVTHGFNSEHDDPLFFDPIQEIGSKPNTLACFIDYVPLADVPFTQYSSIDISGIGQEIAEKLLLPIYQQCKTPYVYIAGHSMGAHVIGLAGRYLNDTYGHKPDVCAGLDAGGPTINPNPDGSITSTDCKLVTILRTNSYGAGTVFTSGKVNFIANDGSNQPGCDLNLVCNHIRALNYFNESIVDPCGIVAKPCFSLFGMTNYPRLGENIAYNLYIPASANGDYCFKTNSQSPYALGPPCSTIPPTITTPEPTATTPETETPETETPETETPETETPETETPETPVTPEDCEPDDEYHWDDSEDSEIPTPDYCQMLY